MEGASEPTSVANKSVKLAVVLLLFAIVIVILGARFFVPLHYAAAMPRTRQANTGQIYRVMVGSGIHVYLNKREADLLDFLDYKLSAVAVGCMFLLLYLKLRRKWF